MIRRRYPDMPVPAGGALVVDGDRILMVRRHNPPNAGQWSIPGGVQEVGETLTEAVRREVIEETGMTLADLSLMDVGDLLEYDADGQVEYHYVITYFRCHPEGGILNACDDVDDVRWFTKDAIEALEVSSRLKQLAYWALECEAGKALRESQII